VNKLEKKNINLEKEIKVRRLTEEALRGKTHDLGERIKELNCLYSILTICSNPGISMEEIFQRTVEVIPPAWQHPEITCSQIIIDDNPYKAGNFKETRWKQSSDILVTGKQVGTLDICYLEERPQMDEGPFLKEEKELINVIAEMMGCIIERMQAEENNKQLEIQLQQARKMESIGILAGGIAHDFNNMLFPILGYTDLILADLPEDSPLRDNLKEVYASALRARDLVKQILTFSRQGTSELKLMKLQPIVKEALKLIRSLIPTTIDIKQDIRSDCGIIKADPTQIHQIVMNLTTNAYHAMEDNGGEMTVSLKKIELGKYDIISPDMEPGVYACLTIADTGIGMDKDMIEKIFDPFFTTKEQGKGTGMGLSVVHGIVKKMGGAIQVYSKPGEGTTFHVYFPVEKEIWD